MLFPRVALLSTTQANPLSDHVEGMTVYNTANVGDVTAGHYYNDGSKWIKIATEESAAVPSFFYMPSMLLPTDISDPSYNSVTEIFTINLHSNYAAQFGLTNSVSVKDPSASVLPVLANNKLEYFITYYDNSVFQNVSVSDTGILTYKLASTYTITEKTFMNIVFKVK